MRRRPKETIERELTITRERLAMYIEREKEMLNREGVQMYTIGSRNLQRYQTALADVQKMIETLQKRERELMAELAGHTPRRALGIIPRDW